MRIVMVALGCGLATTGFTSTQPIVTPAGIDTTVAIGTFQFRPRTLSVPVGSTIKWMNGDEIEHTVTAGVPDTASGGFNGILATQGATFTRVFDRPGTYTYFCDRHHFMRGEIRVTSTGEK
jgi:plastocyanin